MRRFREIVVGIDFTDTSRRALRQADQIAGSEGARLVALHVITPTEAEDYLRGFRIPTEDMIDAFRNSVRELVAAELGTDRTVVAEARIGAPYHELIERTEGGSCDLLVLGSRGKEADADQVGFFSAKCVRHAKVPVLLARLGQTEPFSRVVACVDFSESTPEVLSTALRVAADDGAHLDIVHAVRPPWDKATHVLYDLKTVEDDDFKTQYREVLQGEMDGAVKAMGTAAGVTCESHILEHQSPEMAIIDFLKESGADVVVVGRSGHTVKKLKHYLIGSTAERLIHRSPCSVLTVPCLD